MNFSRLRLEPISIAFALYFFFSGILDACSEDKTIKSTNPKVTQTVTVPDYDYTPTPFPDLTPEATPTPGISGTPTPIPTYSVILITEDVARDQNFISGQATKLDIAYIIMPAPTGNLTWEIVPINTTGNDKMYTADATGLDYSDTGHLRFYPQHTGSSTDGSEDEPEGLEYNLRCLIDGNLIQEFTIEQDDVNRARQEFVVFGLNEPARSSFPSISTNVHVGRSSNFYGIEAFLENGYENMYSEISAIGTVYVNSTWRNPYFNKSRNFSFATNGHCFGKAIDTSTSPNNAQTYSDRWDGMHIIGDRCMLENGPAILRNSDFAADGRYNDQNPAYNNTGWRELPPSHDHYDRDDKRYYNYILDGETLEIGYQEASHYHNNND